MATTLQVILQSDVEKVGKSGELVKVRPGFARNFLLPQGKAIRATESRVAELEHHRRIVAEKAAKELKDLRARKDQLEAQTFSVSARAGEGGRLFGSVTSAQIATVLAERGFEIDRRRIDLREGIKLVGEHAVPVKLHRDVIAKIKVLVVAVEGAPEEAEEEAEEPRASDEDRRERRRRRRDEESDEEPEESDED